MTIIFNHFGLHPVPFPLLEMKKAKQNIVNRVKGIIFGPKGNNRIL